jgi:hypothetical protein
MTRGAAEQRTALPSKRALRQTLALLATILTGLASVATSDVECPHSVSLPETQTLSTQAPTATQHYRASADHDVSIHVLLEAKSSAPGLVRARVVPDGSVGNMNDAGGEGWVELALRPATETHTELLVTGASFSLFIELLEGDEATVSWEVVAETDSCDGYHVRVDRD